MYSSCSNSKGLAEEDVAAVACPGSPTANLVDANLVRLMLELFVNIGDQEEPAAAPKLSQPAPMLPNPPLLLVPLMCVAAPLPTDMDADARPRSGIDRDFGGECPR